MAAALNATAHVVNRQQRHLHGGECFHLHACLPHGFNRGGALHAVGGFVLILLFTPIFCRLVEQFGAGSFLPFCRCYPF